MEVLAVLVALAVVVALAVTAARGERPPRVRHRDDPRNQVQRLFDQVRRGLR